MKVLSSTKPEHLEEDLPELERVNKELMTSDKHPTWSWFGGMITIKDREYQVAPDPTDAE
jgi:hypothetical protein